MNEEQLRQFHRHLDVCGRCESNPFNLCHTGHMLLTAAGEKPRMEKTKLEHQAMAIQSMVDECHGRSVAAGWYNDPNTGAPIERNLAEMMALEHSEISERLEAVRKSLPSDHLPGFSGEEEEAADTLIRLLDYCGFRGIDLGKAYIAKLEYNATRPDHKLSARKEAGGKKF